MPLGNLEKTEGLILNHNLSAATVANDASAPATGDILSLLAFHITVRIIPAVIATFLGFSFSRGIPMAFIFGPAIRALNSLWRRHGNLLIKRAN